MGYMSTNVYSTSEKGFARLVELIKASTEKSKCASCQCGDSCATLPMFDIEEHVSGGVVFGYDYVKFYACRFDPFHEAWSEFVQEGHPWTRVRIGEETDDVEEEWSDDPFDTGIPYVMVKRTWDYDICG